MPSLLDRVINIAEAEDEAVNAASGGSPRETISGTVGRACGKGEWWARYIARPLIEAQPWFGSGHCARQAAIEAQRRAAEGQ